MQIYTKTYKSQSCNYDIYMIKNSNHLSYTNFSYVGTVTPSKPISINFKSGDFATIEAIYSGKSNCSINYTKLKDMISVNHNKRNKSADIYYIDAPNERCY